MHLVCICKFYVRDTSAFVYHDERKKRRNLQLGDVVFDVLQNSQNWYESNASLSVRIISLLNFRDSK